MITRLYTCQAKLNKSDKDYKKYLAVINDEGVLLVDNELFVISFTTEEEFHKNVDYNDLKHIGDITL